MNDQASIAPDIFGHLISALSPTAIYEYSWMWAGIVSVLAVAAFTVTPGFRYIGELVQSMKEGKRPNTTGIAVDLMSAALLYGLYTVVGYLIYKYLMFFMDVLGAFNHYNALKTATADLVVHMGVTDFSLSIFDGLSFVPSLLVFSGYLLTQFAYLAVGLFLHYAHAFTTAVVIIIGPLLIGLSVWKQTNYLAGWGKFLATIMLWPVVEWFGTGLVLSVVEGALKSLPPELYSGMSSLQKMNFIWTSFIVVNLLFLGITIAVPLLTNAIVTGSGNIASTVLPFAAAGAAAGKLASDGMRKGAEITGKGMGNMAANSGSGILSMAANSDGLRNAFPRLDQAFNKLNMPRPNSTSSFDFEDAEPGSVADKFNNLERSQTMMDSRSTRTPSVKSGTGVDRMGEIEEYTTTPSSRGEGLSLSPKTDNTPITTKSVRPKGSRPITQGEPTSRVVNDGGLELTIDEPVTAKAPSQTTTPDTHGKKSSRTPGRDLDFSKIKTGEDELHEMALREKEPTSVELDAKHKARQKRKGVFADQAMKKSGKRKPTKQG